ncbi:uncharacterized protein An14g01890 [Aspergillus niger]|uniref:Contig An14c0080, genomic contig n=2 Tax=Aspergillus niger TaxID=5061 RepID=A2R2T5_ASPNC|nr:uncharacterized protein An14g01890 [Aspergillus niger]CAK46501.1 unnamed protein product [Aspergillus niger]
MEVAWADPGRTEPMRLCPNGLNFVIADDRMMNKIRYNEVIRSGGLQEELGCSHEVVFKSGYMKWLYDYDRAIQDGPSTIQQTSILSII